MSAPQRPTGRRRTTGPRSRTRPFDRPDAVPDPPLRAVPDAAGAGGTRDGADTARGLDRAARAPRVGSGDPAGRSEDHVQRCMRAAVIAKNAHPGPLGELLRREILTHLELGCRFVDANALVPRLVEDLLAQAPRPDGPARDPSSPATPSRCPAPPDAHRFEG